MYMQLVSKYDVTRISDTQPRTNIIIMGKVDTSDVMMIITWANISYCCFPGPGTSIWLSDLNLLNSFLRKHIFVCILRHRHVGEMFHDDFSKGKGLIRSRNFKFTTQIGLYYNLIYLFVAVNFDALAQESDVRFVRKQVVYPCWMQDSNPEGLWNRISSRLNARWQTDWAIEGQAKTWTRQPVPMISEHSAYIQTEPLNAVDILYFHHLIALHLRINWSIWYGNSKPRHRPYLIRVTNSHPYYISLLFLNYTFDLLNRMRQLNP